MPRNNFRPERKSYPCVIYELQPYNPEYANGYRFRVHDIDDDQFLFITKERMYEQLTFHGFRQVLPDDMEKIRKNRQAKQRKSF